MPLANARRSPRDSLFLEKPVLQEAVDRLVEALRVVRERLEVLEVEALAEDGRDGEDVAHPSGRRSTRASTACWIVSGSASEEMPVAPERFRAPESSRAIPPKSRSERTSSFW